MTATPALPILSKPIFRDISFMSLTATNLLIFNQNLITLIYLLFEKSLFCLFALYFCLMRILTLFVKLLLKLQNIISLYSPDH